EADGAARRLDEAEEAAPDRRLAGPRFADEAHHLAAADAEADAVDRRHLGTRAAEGPTARQGKALGEARDLEKWRAHGWAERRQRLRWPGAIRASGGSAVRQASCARRQRGAKAQPGGRSSAPLGTLPGMARSRALRPASRAARSTRGR